MKFIYSQFKPPTILKWCANLMATAVVLLMGISSQSALAQVSALLNPTYGYTFSNTTTTYTPLSGGTVFQSGATLNTNGVSTAITLPFTFTYNGIKENTIFISNNGFITFALAPTATQYFPISSTTSSGYDGVIAGAAMNCVASTAVGAVPEIRYGSSGGDFIVQFQDIGQSFFVAIRLTFQIVLKADGKTVQIVYGPNNVGVASAVECQVGLRGTGEQDWNNRTLASGGNWNTAGGASGTVAQAMSLTDITTLPTSGRTFQWVPTAYTPTYLTNPAGVAQDFTTWVNGSGPANVPSTNWATNGYGNASWQIDNTTATTTTSGWTGTGGAYSPVDYVNAVGGRSARFHTFNATSPQVGYLDYYVDMSTITGTPTLDFFHINTSGTDILQVFLSTNGGTTFTQLGANIGVSATWTAISRSLGATNSATTIIRFKATSDFGFTDIGIDRVVIPPPPAPPTVSSFTPNTNLCINGGQTVTITGTNFTSTYAVTFNGVNAASFSVVSSTTITAVTPAVLGAGIITVTTLGGSANSVAYTVIANPTAAINPTSAAVCSGTPVALTASGGGTYAWSPTTGLDFSNVAAVNANPSSTTTYTVTVTNTGCTSTASVAVTVTPSVSATASATPSAVCAGGNTQLNVAAVQSFTTPAAASYAFAGSTGTYATLTGTTSPAPTVLNGVAVLGSDDVGVGNIPIGFSFNYNGTLETVFGVSSNGFIQLGNTSATITGFSANALASTAKVIAPFWDDNNTTSTTVRYRTAGTAPNRTLTVEWAGIKIGGGGTGTNTLNIQAILYEATGVVQLVYGSSTVGTGAISASIGISGASGNYRSVTPLLPANTSTSSTSSENTTIAAFTNIPSGTIYTFTPAGAPSFTYAWSESPAGSTLAATNIANPMANSILVTKTYTVTVTGNGGCTATSSVTVSASAALTATPTATPATICAGAGASSTLAAGAAGGGAPYTYLWSNPAASTTATVSVSPSSTTTYTVTVTDACLATATASVTVTVNPLPSAAITANPSSASICGTGSVILNVPTGATTYAWLPATGLSATNTASVTASPTTTTTYTVTVTGSNGCTATSTQVVTVATAITATASATPSAICVGGNSQLNVAVPGSNPAASIKITEVCLLRIGTGGGVYPAFAPGADLVEITNISSSPVDISGWTLSDHASNTAAAIHTGFAFPASTIIPANSVAVVCLGTGTNDVPNRYYNTGGFNEFWSSNSLVGFVLKNGSTVIDAVGCGSGYVFNAGTGVTAGDWSGFAPSASGLAGTTRTAAVDNNTGANWSASSSVTLTIGVYNAGFTPPPTISSYAWTPSTYIVGQEALQNPLATAVMATQTYNVVVTTSEGCTATSSVTVTAGIPLTATPTATPATICAGASTTIAAVAAGDGAPYTYLWDNGAGTGATATVSPSSTTTYNVTVTDACLATATGSITVTVNPLPTATAGSNSLVCVGADLNLTATTDIGTTFAWAGPNSFTSSTQNPSITGATLAATGTYTVTVSAATGCSATATTVVAVVASPTVTASASPATICVGSSSTLTANAGITPASGTPTYCSTTTTITASYDCVSNVVFGTISNSSSTISSGTGYVDNTAISTNVNCGASYTLALTVGAYSSANYIAAWIDYNNDGTFSAGEKVAQSGALGTVATFSTTVAIPYLASNASVRMRVREAYGAIDGANMSPCGSVTHGEVEDYTVNIIAPAYTYLWNDPSAATTSTLSVTPATTTTYTVTVTSAGCAITSSVTVTVNSATVAGITNNTGSTELTCNTTSISVTATGGTTYAWSGGATPGTAANSFNAAGTYTVTVTGSNGCSSTAAITITSNTTPPSAGLNNDGPLTCALTSVTLTGTGGVSYAYSGGSASVTAPGTYTVTVTGSNGCTATATTVVTQNITTPTAGLSNDGPLTCTKTSVALTGTGGGTYAYSGGSAIVSAPGTYTVTVTGANGCTATATTTIASLATASSNGPVCEGGTATLSVNPNLPVGVTVTYAWSGPAGAASTQNPNIPNMTPSKIGTYTVTVTYSTGCTATATTVLATNPKPVVSSVAGNCVSGIGRITVNATGTGLTYNMGTGAQTNNVFNGVANGTYTVTITNAIGCTATANVTVNCSVCPTVVASSNSPVCTSGNILLSVNPNLPVGVTATYSWSGPGGTATLQNPTISNATPTKAGVYTVTVTYSNGCIATASTTVSLSPTLTGSIIGPVSFCVGASAVLTANGGGTYVWSTGATTAAITVTTAGAYVVTITNGAACKRLSKTVTTTTCKNTVATMPETLLVTPNPFSTYTTIEFMTNSNGHTSINVYSIDGRQLATLYNANTQAGEIYQVTLDGANLPNGMYFVEMTNANGKKMLVKAMLSN